MKMNKTDNTNKRRFLVGAAVLTAAVLAIAIFTVLLCYKLNWSYDMTQERIFTLSSQTVAALDDLNTEVRIAAVYPSGQEEQMVKTLLSEYTKASDKISVEYIDAEQEPAKLASYRLDVAAVNNGSIIIRSNSRYRILDNASLFEETGEGSVFSGEREITGAIRYCTSEKMPVVYFVEGDGETDSAASLTKAVSGLQQDAYKVQTLRLTEGAAIPDDASLLVFVSPKTDITADELVKIDAYIRKGGSIFMMIDSIMNSNETDYTNLSKLANEFGIGITNNYVIEEDSRYFLSQHNLYLIPLFGSHEIVDPISKAGNMVILPVARGLGMIDYDKTEIQNTVLLQSSEKSWIRADMTITNASFTENDYMGPAPLAYASVKSNVKWGQEAARMVVVGNSSYALDGNIEVQANRDFFLNCASWLAGEQKSEVIASKTINSGALIIRGSEFTGLSILCVAVLPGLAFLTAIIVWMRRRNQ